METMAGAGCTGDGGKRWCAPLESWQVVVLTGHWLADWWALLSSRSSRGYVLMNVANQWLMKVMGRWSAMNEGDEVEDAQRTHGRKEEKEQQAHHPSIITHTHIIVTSRKGDVSFPCVLGCQVRLCLAGWVPDHLRLVWHVVLQLQSTRAGRVAPALLQLRLWGCLVGHRSVVATF